MIVHFVGSVEHYWSIVLVFLLLNAAIYSDMCIAFTVDLKRDLEFGRVNDLLREFSQFELTVRMESL